jgi:hypothetical protein
MPFKKAVGGKPVLAANLAAIPLTPGFTQVRWLGVAQDADEDADAAFVRIRDALRRVGLPEPSRVWETTSTTPVVVAFVLPDGAAPGDLETLVWRAVAGEPATPCVDAYMDCLSHAAGAAVPRQEWKARVHAYLASLSRPDLRLGEAAENTLLPLGSPMFDPLVNLIPGP